MLKIPFLSGVTNYVILRNRNQQNADSQLVTFQTTSASEDEISHSLWINSVNVFSFISLFHYFTLSKMCLEELLISSYGKELYKHTSLLQQMKIKNAVAKNQMISLQRCIYHNFTPKSFRLKTPIKSRKTSSLRRKNILHGNWLNFRQHQVKDTTSKLQPHELNQALLTLRTLH